MSYKKENISVLNTQFHKHNVKLEYVLEQAHI